MFQSNALIRSYSQDTQVDDLMPRSPRKGLDKWAIPSEQIRKNCSLKMYQDAHSLDQSNTCWEDMYDAIINAEQIIYITGWSLDVETKLKPHTPFSLTLGELLKQKASEGVKVYVLLWKVRGIKDFINTRNYSTKKFFKKTGVKYAMWHSDNNRFIYTMHQKMLICDSKKKVIAFLGGLDMTYGRYDTPDHPLFRDNEHDKCNATKAKFLKDENTPRQPWHDVHCKVEGPVVGDLMSHFCMRWKSVKNKTPRRGEDLNFDYDKSLGNWRSQMMLSYMDSSVVIRTIQQGYIHAINNSKDYIYIESQYFIGGSKMWNASTSMFGKLIANKRDVAPNMIPITISNRIVRAIENNESLRVYIIIPFHPEGSSTPENDFSVSKIMHLQFLTIQSIYKQIGKALSDNNVDRRPTDYLFVGCLGKVERRPIFDVMVKNMIYVHSKLMIIDDEFIMIGSANLNERSLSGQRDGEVCIGAYETDQDASQLENFRYSLFKEHFGDQIDLSDPSSLQCINDIEELAIRNRINYKNSKIFSDNSHIMAHAFNVTDSGDVIPELLDDVDGYMMSFSGNASKWVFDDFLCA
ncbi:phospholipase D1/2 [Acrasis kona]|uniref:phospholipase D n=1 Tax=Acrasis kona TaxID=1008807 RepID=A0AAW2ZF37_9EUKA